VSIAIPPSESGASRSAFGFIDSKYWGSVKGPKALILFLTRIVSRLLRGAMAL
jgi:hypothetical protein